MNHTGGGEVNGPASYQTRGGPEQRAGRTEPFDYRADLLILVSILLIICGASWGLMRWQLNRVQNLLESGTSGHSGSTA